MSIDIMSREGHAPFVVMDEDWFLRVLGFYRISSRAFLEVLGTYGQPVMIPLQEETCAATANTVLVYYVAISQNCEIKGISAAPVNSTRTDSVPLSFEHLAARVRDMASDAFIMEMVDLASVGKIDLKQARQLGTAFRCVAPIRRPRSQHHPPPS